MDASNIINLGLLGVTAVGVIVAIYSAAQANRARGEARAASDKAAGHERAALAAAERSAGAATRSASALEEANVIARAQLPRDPIELRRSSGHQWQVTNIGSQTLFGFAIVEVTNDGRPADVTLLNDDPVDLHPGDSAYFIYERSAASPATTTILVSWGFPDAAERTVLRRTIN